MKAKEYLEMYRSDLAGQMQGIMTRQTEDVVSEIELNKMRIEECGEPLVPILDYVGNAVISMRDTRIRYRDETLYLRRTVAEQLMKVAEHVSPRCLKIYDGFRPLEYQQQRYDLIYQQERARNPDWTEEQLKEKMFINVFPPSWDPQKPPAHSTGGAIDLTILDEEGRDLDMGSKWGDFDSPYLSSNALGLSLEQRANRELLFTVMGENGLINFPGEWWHFSFGDREWVKFAELDVPAIYGRAEDPYKWR
jgi:zinc D-Ala-D-Ala dipeptidase